jgi:GNAT superfamily N-acetyltransferase
LRRVEVTRTYLALDDPARLRPSSHTAPAPPPRRVDPCPVPLYRRLYKEVGEQWFWHDRLEWSDEQLSAHLSSRNVGVWVVEDGEDLIGYYELQLHEDGGVEIVYFGLTPAHIGRGIGGWMLTRAVDDAWRMGARRVWLHTCTLDSERALPNYISRGFVPFKTERLEVEIEGTQVVGERIL